MCLFFLLSFQSFSFPFPLVCLFLCFLYQSLPPTPQILFLTVNLLAVCFFILFYCCLSVTCVFCTVCHLYILSSLCSTFCLLLVCVSLSVRSCNFFIDCHLYLFGDSVCSCTIFIVCLSSYCFHCLFRAFLFTAYLLLVCLALVDCPLYFFSPSLLIVCLSLVCILLSVYPCMPFIVCLPFM